MILRINQELRIIINMSNGRNSLIDMVVHSSIAQGLGSRREAGGVGVNWPCPPPVVGSLNPPVPFIKFSGGAKILNEDSRS